MTRRILLPLHESTTETECGGCPSLGYLGYCRAYRAYVCGAIDWERLPECLAAEREARAMERDAALGRAVRERGITAIDMDAALGRAVRESGFNGSDADAVRAIYSWAGNGASRIVECMRAIAAALRAEREKGGE